MGVVYKAENAKLKRPVALKFLRFEAIEDDERRQRFLREAQAAELEGGWERTFLRPGGHPCGSTRELRRDVLSRATEEAVRIPVLEIPSTCAIRRVA